MRWIALVLAACAAHGSAPTSAGFRVFYPSTEAPFKLHTRMQAKPAADCHYDNGRDAKWANTGAKIVAGNLPPGLALEDGAIAGAPSQPGSWTVTIVFTGVTCAGRSQPDQRVVIALVIR